MDMMTTRKPARKPNLRRMATIGDVESLKVKLCELEQQVATLGMKDSIDSLAARVAELEAIIKKK